MSSAALLPASADRARRRRRPTGAPPPLPRKIGFSGWVWLAALGALLVLVVAAMSVDPVLRVVDRADSAILRQVAELRTAWLTDVMTRIDLIGSGWTLTIVGVGMLVALMAFRRWRHLLTFLGSLVVVEIIGQTVYSSFSRPRPYGVTIIGRWSGFSMPSPPVAVLAIVLLGIAYTLVVPGRPRSMAKWAVGAVVLVFVAARLYLGVDHPSDVVVGVAIGVGFTLLAFRLFTPNEVFPVTYRRGKTAHLDVTGRRGEAIRQALLDQLGLTVIETQPVGLEGSGGSTPLRMRVAGDPDTYIFGKLYAMSHVRADRWYKLGRTLLYGRLEDETPFGTVRRLVEYEDYTQRLLCDLGIPTAAPYGIVEITPGREYLLVTEFFDGAVEIGDADLDDDLIDQGLMLIRRLWDAGLAHRDIKPANLLVHEGQVLLIDVMFVQVRPSPWRQAVDLANMMLVLAVRTDAERVYQRALLRFTRDEIGEAFAAARGVASPSQLRMVMKQDGRDLLAEFRRLGPDRQPVALQRWSFRRVAMALGLVGLTIFAVAQVTDMLSPVHDLPVEGSPDCGSDDIAVLVAQSVPSASALPCIATLPAGWNVDGLHVERGRTTFWLDSDVAGDRAARIQLTSPDECDVSDAVSVPSDEVRAQRFEQPQQLPPDVRSTRYYLFDGGCVSYRFSFAEGASASNMLAVDQAVALQPRADLVERVRVDSRLRLCGAGVPCPS